MPLYDYRCPECGHTFERIGRFSDGPTFPCRHCGAAAKRLLGVPALQFKGSGWYVTDYGRGNSGPRTASSAEGDGGAGTPSGNAESGGKAESGSSSGDNGSSSAGSSNSEGSSSSGSSSSGSGSETGSKTGSKPSSSNQAA